MTAPSLIAAAMCLAMPPILGALAGAAAWRRMLALALAAAALALPFFAPEIPIVRAVLALTVALGFARVWELATGRLPGLGVRARAVHASAFVDSQSIRREPPDWGQIRRAVLRALAFLPLAGASLAVIVGSDSHPVELAAGALLAYAVTDIVYALVWAGYHAAGSRLPLLHRDPILARSVGEFWLRWNTTVGGFLSRRIHAPLARAGHPHLGLATAFAASAALHAYFAGVPLGARMAGFMIAFFALQAVAIAIERALSIRRWPRWAAHAWVISVLAASSPLFVEPLLRLFES